MSALLSDRGRHLVTPAADEGRVRHVSSFQPHMCPIPRCIQCSRKSTCPFLSILRPPSTASAMSQLPDQTVRYEREPLLHQSHVEQATNPVAPYRDSSASVDRLQHHREMVRDRYSVNWWLEWVIILVSRAIIRLLLAIRINPMAIQLHSKAMQCTAKYRSRVIRSFSSLFFQLQGLRPCWLLSR